jgi:GT2 family glycosyltransferase
MKDTSTSNILTVILNYNGKSDTYRCIESIQSQTISADIFVVDNNSNDGLDKEISRIYPDILYSRQEKNLGFAGGVNIGIKYALDHNYEYVCLINNDAIASPNWIQLLYEASVKNKSFITVGTMLDEVGNTIDSCGEMFSSWGVSFPRLRDKNAQHAPDSGFVFGATGGGVLYRTDLFNNIGLFDEKFFLYYEDADISFRSQLRGYTTFYEKNAVLYHKRGASTNKVSGLVTYHTFKNLPLLVWKNTPTSLLFPIGSRFILLYLLISLNAILKGSLIPVTKGVFMSGWVFWTDTVFKRYDVQKNKKVSTQYIQSVIYHDLPPEQTGMRHFRKFFTGKD